MRKLSVLIALLLLIPAAAQAKSLDELLVDKGIITKAEAVSAGGHAKVYWNKGTRIEFPDNGFSTSIATLIQPRYEFVDNDSDSGLGNTSGVELNTARVIVAGHALNKEFTYKMQYDLVGDVDAGGESSPRLLDAIINWNFCDSAWARIGQWKTGISRQYNTSRSSLQFADRSNATNFFNLGRQNGAAVGGNWDGALEWSASMYNGQSDGEGINRPGVDTNHTGIVAVRYNAMGEMDALSEGDVEWTDDMAVNLGAAYGFSDYDEMGINTETSHISVDASMKYQGWSLHGEFYYSTEDPDVGSDIDSVGFYVQGGYFVQPKKLELAARVGYIDYEDDAGLAQDDQTEATVGLNYYWWKHHLKAQLNYVYQRDNANTGGTDLSTNRWLLQLTSWF